MEFQNTRTSDLRSASKTKRKKSKTCPEPRKHTKNPPLAPLFFGTMLLFLIFFGLHQRVPLHFFRYFATQWMSKNPESPPFYIFRHCDTVRKSHFFKFLGKLLKTPKGPPFNFFHVLQPAAVLQNLKGPPFYIFEP